MQVNREASTTTPSEGRQPTCAERWSAHLEGRLADLRTLWDAYCDGEEEHEELGSIYDYGLSFDYVEANTFNDQPLGYYRYQLSWGGPSDEFRLYPWDHERITYVFMDWFDGEERDIPGPRENLWLLRDLFGWFGDAGMMTAHEEDF